MQKKKSPHSALALAMVSAMALHLGIAAKLQSLYPISAIAAERVGEGVDFPDATPSADGDLPYLVCFDSASRSASSASSSRTRWVAMFRRTNPAPSAPN